MRNQEAFRNAAGGPAHVPCSGPLTSQPTSGRERLDHIRCSTGFRSSGIRGGNSAFAKSRGGGMVTTAAGHLISPQGRETERGEAYGHASTAPHEQERQPPQKRPWRCAW